MPPAVPVVSASSGSDPETIEKMRLFGEYTGIAFQIKDDLFDYESGNATGKPAAIDIKEQKMTLPLIYLLNHSGLSEKRWIVNTVKNHNTEPLRVAELIEKVKANGGIAYAHEKMLETSSKSNRSSPDFPGKYLPEFSRTTRDFYY